MASAAPHHTVHLHVGTKNSFDYEKFVLSPQQLSGDVASLRDSLCAANALDATKHRLFLDHRCLDHSQPVMALPWTSAKTLVLRLAEGCLRIRFVNDTVPDMRLAVDLEPRRRVAELTDQVREATGFYVTPIKLVCKNSELATAANGGEGGGKKDQPVTLGDTDLKLDDVVLVVRSSETVVVDSAETEQESATLDVVFYGQHYRVQVAKTATIADLKAQLCKDVFVPTSANDHMTASVPSELRVVQCNVNFDNASTIAELQQVPVEILRQWGPEHLSREDNFVGYGSLRFNCPFCATAGAVVELRPMCSLCNGENVVMNGTNKSWNNVVNSTAHCNACSADAHIYWGFFCRSVCCGSRCSTHRRRDMIAVYDSAQNHEALLAAINSCFSYASIAGRVDASAVDSYVAVQIPATAASGIPTALDLSSTADWDAIMGVKGPAEGGGEEEEDVAAAASAEAATSEETRGVTGCDADTGAATANGTTDRASQPVTCCKVTQQAMIARGLNLPDTFFTRSGRDGSSVFQWFGMPEGFQLALADSPDVANVPVDLIIALPSYGNSGQLLSGGSSGGGGGGGGAAKGGSADLDSAVDSAVSPSSSLTFVLIPQRDSPPGTPQDAAETQGWLQSLLSAKLKVGPFEWSPLTGFGTRDNARVAFSHVAKASNRLSVTIQPLKPLTANAYSRLLGSVLEMDALGEAAAMEAFSSGFSSVDDIYSNSTPRLSE